jgi:Kef-type K+ transport system membrane component KefB
VDMHLAAHFFFEVAVILVACRLLGLVARRLGQPQVIGEMIAGIVLGPSLLGWLLPDVQQAIFQEATRPVLQVVSQVGLVLYMFTIGLEFDITHVRRQARSAISISLAGIVAPLILGGLLARAIHGIPELFPGHVSPATAMLFMGTAMSVTAFPVLSRIIHERGLLRLPIGALALAAGSIDDAVAWCLLAVVLATLSGMSSGALLAIGGGIGYVALVLILRRFLFHRFAASMERAGKVTTPLLATVLVLLMLGAWFTDKAGIHAVFGAFVLGAALPRGRFAHAARELVEPVTVSLLIPLFFTFSGLNTRLGLVDTPFLWGLAAAAVAVACLGKGVACWAAARASGVSPREARGLGALMNARGLMELIMLNIALAAGIIGPALFSVMVIMAITTTVMATPLFTWLYERGNETAQRVQGNLTPPA